MADSNTTNYNLTKPEVGSSQDSWGGKLNTNFDTIDTNLKSVSDVANGKVSDLSDLGITATAAEINALDGITSTVAELNILDGVTATAADINYAAELKATGVTATEFNKLDGLTATTTELNYVDGVTSAIQTQLNGKQGSMATASTAEMEAGTVTSLRAMTPKLVSQAIAALQTDQSTSTVTKSNNGRLNLTNGLQLRWGRRYSYEDAPETFSFHYAFSNDSFVVFLQSEYATSSMNVSSHNASSFVANRSDSLGDGYFMYFAIGY